MPGWWGWAWGWLYLRRGGPTPRGLSSWLSSDCGSGNPRLGVSWRFTKNALLLSGHKKLKKIIPYKGESSDVSDPIKGKPPSTGGRSQRSSCRHCYGHQPPGGTEAHTSRRAPESGCPPASPSASGVCGVSEARRSRLWCGRNSAVAGKSIPSLYCGHGESIT